MSAKLRGTLMKTAAILAMVAPSIGTTISSVPAVSANSQVATAHKGQKSQKLNPQEYPKYTNQLRQDQLHLDEDKDKANQTGTAGTTLAQQMVPKAKAKVNRDKQKLPKNLQQKAENEAKRDFNNQNAQSKKRKANKAKKAQKNQEKKTNRKLVNKPAKPKKAAKQTPKQKAAQRDAKGEAANTTGQKKLPKQHPASFKNNMPKHKVVKRSLPQTLEKQPMTYVGLGAGVVLVLAGGAYFIKRCRATK